MAESHDNVSAATYHLCMLALLQVSKQVHLCDCTGHAYTPACHGKVRLGSVCNSNCSSPDIIMYISTNLHLFA